MTDSVAFEAAGASGRVRPLRSGHDTMRRQVIHRKLAHGLRARGVEWAEYADLRIAETYAGLCVAAEACDGIAFPSMADAPDAIASAFALWLERDNSVYLATAAAYDAANAPTNDAALLPPEQVPPEKKVNTPDDAPNTGAGGTSA